MARPNWQESTSTYGMYIKPKTPQPNSIHPVVPGLIPLLIIAMLHHSGQAIL